MEILIFKRPYKNMFQTRVIYNRVQAQLIYIFLNIGSNHVQVTCHSNSNYNMDESTEMLQPTEHDLFHLLSTTQLSFG